MPVPYHRRLRAAQITLTTLAMAGGVLAAATAPVQANPSGTGLVVSEVYGGGGNAGATWTNDFVELYNPTDAAIDVDGWSVQYRSATGTSAQVTELSGSVPPGGYYLVQEAAGSGGSDNLPTPDATGSIAMSGSKGVVLLVPSTEPFAMVGDLAGNSALADMVGFGDTTSFETAPAPTLTNTTSAARTVGADTDDNSNDFAAVAPTPTNTAGEGDPDVDPPTDPVELAIAEIQGAGAISPVMGDSVTTDGVVTAAYREGGFFGFYLQTPGTGGQIDLAGHTASDAVFVRQRSGSITVQPGDHVSVTGTVTEYAGATQIETAAGDIDALAPAEPVAPVVSDWPASDTQKETLEGMLFDASGHFVVSDTYSTNRYGEVGLARGTTPLRQPTDVAAAGTAEAAGVSRDNATRAITLDDGSSWNYLDFEQNRDRTPPYVSNLTPVRVGAAVSFTAPVILTEGGSPAAPTYRFQPTAQATDDVATWPAAFENTRTGSPDSALLSQRGAPQLKVASFNVLNYFTTLGDADDDNVGEGGCGAYLDRDGDGNNVRSGCEQRGAWDPADLRRQQEKIVAAINALGADVVGLMEIENSAALGESPDEATQTLVAALNAAAGTQRWAANPSSAELPDVSQQDVITNAIIYRTAAVRRVGPARALGDRSGAGDAFGNAREPIGQVFAPVAGGDPFLFVVNHFKSKGSAGPWPGDADAGDGQGASNESRVRQATALREWVADVESETAVDDVLLVGDFNSYTQEDPLQVLYDAGYADAESALGDDEQSYSFGGLVGSLDHVLVNAGALERLTGTDIWSINSGESIAMEYSRFNNHATDFHRPDMYRSSDHDPVIVGLDAGEATKAASTITAKATPKKVVAQKTRPKLRIRVDTTGAVATGKVRIEVAGTVRLVRLDRVGKRAEATVRLAAFKKIGSYPVTVTYLGNDQTLSSSARINIKVVGKR